MGYKLELLHTVACMYYIKNLKQDSIARRLDISRYKVCRILKKAREKGLVRIKVLKNID
jgi:DNA-binding transcriptional regulator LsrR (DeoR family)